MQKRFFESILTIIKMLYKYNLNPQKMSDYSGKYKKTKLAENVETETFKKGRN